MADPTSIEPLRPDPAPRPAPPPHGRPHETQEQAQARYDKFKADHPDLGMLYPFVRLIIEGTEHVHINA